MKQLYIFWWRHLYNRVLEKFDSVFEASFLVFFDIAANRSDFIVIEEANDKFDAAQGEVLNIGVDVASITLTIAPLGYVLTRTHR